MRRLVLVEVLNVTITLVLSSSLQSWPRYSQFQILDFELHGSDIELDRSRLGDRATKSVFLEFLRNHNEH